MGRGGSEGVMYPKGRVVLEGENIRLGLIKSFRKLLNEVALARMRQDLLSLAVRHLNINHSCSPGAVGVQNLKTQIEYFIL